MPKHKCHRCGVCCMRTGSAFWTRTLQDGSELVPAQILTYIESKARRYKKVHHSNDQPCDMLMPGADGKWICVLHRFYGKQAKPQICREYPVNKKRCIGMAKNFKLEDCE